MIPSTPNPASSALNTQNRQDLMGVEGLTEAAKRNFPDQDENLAVSNFVKCNWDVVTKCVNGRVIYSQSIDPNAAYRKTVPQEIVVQKGWTVSYLAKVLNTNYNELYLKLKQQNQLQRVVTSQGKVVYCLVAGRSYGSSNLNSNKSDTYSASSKPASNPASALRSVVVSAMPNLSSLLLQARTAEDVFSVMHAALVQGNIGLAKDCKKIIFDNAPPEQCFFVAYNLQSRGGRYEIAPDMLLALDDFLKSNLQIATLVFSVAELNSLERAIRDLMNANGGSVPFSATYTSSTGRIEVTAPIIMTAYQNPDLKIASQQMISGIPCWKQNCSEQGVEFSSRNPGVAKDNFNTFLWQMRTAVKYVQSRSSALQNQVLGFVNSIVTNPKFAAGYFPEKIENGQIYWSHQIYNKHNLAQLLYVVTILYKKDTDNRDFYIALGSELVQKINGIPNSVYDNANVFHQAEITRALSAWQDLQRRENRNNPINMFDNTIASR